jgi:hypothetical protein
VDILNYNKNEGELLTGTGSQDRRPGLVFAPGAYLNSRLKLTLGAGGGRLVLIEGAVWHNHNRKKMQYVVGKVPTGITVS